MQRTCDGRIGKQGVHTCQDRVELRQHLLNSRNHISGLTHGTHLLSTGNGIAGSHNAIGHIAQHKLHLNISHQVGSNLSTTALRHLHILINTDRGHNLTGVTVVEIDGLNHTNAITIGKDGTGHRKTAYVLELNEISVIVRKQRHSLQELQTKVEYNNTYYSHKGNLNFFRKLLHIYFFFDLNSRIASFTSTRLPPLKAMINASGIVLATSFRRRYISL